MIKAAWLGLVNFVQEINTTSSRILVSLVLSAILVFSVLVMMFLRLSINETALGILCTFILSMGGLDVIQFTQKRKSFIPDQPADNITPNVTANRVVGNDHGVEFTE